MTKVYRFGNFELDEARFELRRMDRVLAVQPKVLRMLLHLVAQRERAVGNDELFRVLWPGERVGLASIRRAVIGVRRALGELGDSQTSVRTVRGFGYQFVRPMRESAGAMSNGREDWTALAVADTLPLYGRSADRLREQTVGIWQLGRAPAPDGGGL